ncbi:hypothetical protein CPB86DRAFT_820349 [Serendipita vermifera]|nr:hypothetical protein CPB86DRAFT_820349 [Serendipita vermifera]
MEIRWGEIFHLLGTKYIQAAASRELNEDDERGLGILLRCLRNSEIGSIIAPGQTKEYQGGSSAIATIDEDFGELNPVYVLLRNIELPGVALSIEEQVKLRVASLNCTHQTLQSAKQLVTLQRDLTSRMREDMWGDVIPILCEDIKSRAHEDEQKRVDNLICLALLHRPPIQDIPLVLYNGWDNNWQMGNCYIFAPVARPSVFFYRLSCANWIKGLLDHPHIHAILGALHSVRRRNSHLRLLWRLMATEEEVAAALRLVDPDYKFEISKFIEYQRQAHHLPDTLIALDKLVEEGCDEEEFDVIIRLLWDDFKSTLYRESLDSWEIQRLESLQNPWLRLIGYAITGILRGSPFVDSAIIPQLRMRFMREFDRYKMRAFMMGALVDLNKLKRLQTEFTQPSLGIDFGGDYLLHIFHSPFSIGDDDHETFYGRIPDFLVHDNDQPSEFISRFPYKFLRRHSDMRTSADCISHLLELCRDIKRSPGRLTRLLIHMVSSNLEYIKKWNNPICVVDFYDILKIMRECGLGKKGTAYITDSYELAGLVRQCRDEVTGHWDTFRNHKIFGSLMDQTSGKDDFRVRCNEAIHDLRSQPLTTFGLQTCRLLTCTRSTVAADAVVGILRMCNI